MRILCLLGLIAGLAAPVPVMAGLHSETWVRLAIAPETNPQRRTSAETIDMLGLPFVLDDRARERAATALRLSLGHIWAPPLSGRARLRFAALGDARLFRDSTLNEITLRTEAGLEFARGTDGLVGGGVLVQGRWLGGSLWSRAPGVYLTWQERLGQTTVVETRAEALWLSHPDAPGLDGRRATLNLGIRHRAGPRLTLSGTAMLARQQAVAASEGWRAAGVTLGADHAFGNGLTLGLSVGRSRQRHDGPSPLFGRVRADDLTTVGLRLSHRDIRIAGQVPVLELTHERQSSTIALHDYRTTRVSIGFVQRF